MLKRDELEAGIKELASRLANFEEEELGIPPLERFPPREQRRMRQVLDGDLRLLIKGPRGLGKTREALEVLRRLAAARAEPVTVLLPRPPLADPPFDWPPDLPSRNIVLLADDLHEHFYPQPRNGAERAMVMAARDDYRGWLPQTVKFLEHKFSGSDFRVVGMVRDDPLELYQRLDPGRPFWEDFTIYKLDPWAQKRRGELIQSVAHWRGTQVEEAAVEEMAAKSDGTPKAFVTFFKRRDRQEAVSLGEAREEFTGTYPNEWEVVWRKDIQPHPASRYLFMALSLLHQGRVALHKDLAIKLAARLWEERWAWRREPEVEAALTRLGAWVKEKDGLLECREDYLQGRTELKKHAGLVTDLLLTAAGDRARGLELLPSLFDFGFVLGAELARYALAIRVYDRVLELDPQFAPAFYNRGVARSDLAKLERDPQAKRPLLQQAIQDYDQAIELDSQLALAFYNRGVARYHLAELEAEPQAKRPLLQQAI
ncbi:MAG: tetratricopeptide repeat protein, partial [Anaerolineae bacterium]